MEARITRNVAEGKLETKVEKLLPVQSALLKECFRIGVKYRDKYLRAALALIFEPFKSSALKNVSL